MRPVRVTVSSAAASAPIPLNPLIGQFNVGLGATVNSGTLTYQVQYTYDDVFSPSFVASSATWFTHSTITGKTANFDGVITTPCTAVRLNVTAYTSGSVTLTVIQSGNTE